MEHILNLIDEEFHIEFAQTAKPERHKLFQPADKMSTLKLVELKLAHGEMMTESEYKFFGVKVLDLSKGIWDNS